MLTIYQMYFYFLIETRFISKMVRENCASRFIYFSSVIVIKIIFFFIIYVMINQTNLYPSNNAQDFIKV